MLTFEQVLEIFKDYLETDDEVEVLLTKRGYLRIVSSTSTSSSVPDTGGIV